MPLDMLEWLCGRQSKLFLIARMDFQIFLAESFEICWKKLSIKNNEKVKSCLRHNHSTYVRHKHSTLWTFIPLNMFEWL
jgi:hypothetical protein